eukprot:m.80490 g.80490  ORF g.80490 m.80490 type:complete len:399 (-) comp12760_c0_seq2:177-1373(-)
MRSCMVTYIAAVLIACTVSATPPQIHCSWNVKMNLPPPNNFPHGTGLGNMTHTLSQEIQSRMFVDQAVLGGNMGQVPNDPASMLGAGLKGGHATKSSWKTALNDFLGNHSKILTQELQTQLPSNYKGAICHDFEAWHPSALFEMNKVYANKSFACWYNMTQVVKNISSPTFDSDFNSFVHYTPPASATGWATLSPEEQTLFVRQSWTTMSQVFWNNTLNISRQAQPLAKWGQWNLPSKFGINGKDGPWWDSSMDELAWLWPQLDVFYPDLYPEVFASAGAPRPVGLNERCGNYSQSENHAYYVNNTKNAIAIRDKYAPGRPIMLYLWYHYMCDQRVEYYINDDNIEDPFATASALGIEGVVLYGSIETNGDSPDPLAKYLNSEYQDTVVKYCKPVQSN